MFNGVNGYMSLTLKTPTPREELVSDEEGVEDTHPERRNKRPQRHVLDSSSKTPSRPKPSTPKMTHGQDSSWFGDSVGFNPVSIPESVAELFRAPHVFPKDSYQEMLIGHGVTPTYFFETATNSSAFSTDVRITPDIIAKGLQRNAARSEIDDQADALLQQEGCCSSSTTDAQEENNQDVWQEQTSNVIQKPNGTYVVCLKGRQIEFPDALLDLKRIRVMGAEDVGSSSSSSSSRL